MDDSAIHKAVDLNALRAFVEVARATSFSAAGKRLGLPKQEISRRVSRLEAAVGFPLLYRTTRHVSLSPAGDQLLARIAPLLSSIDIAMDTLPEENGRPVGKVHLTIPSIFQTPLIGDALSLFAERYPAVQVDVTYCADIQLVKEGFDIALWLSLEKPDNNLFLSRRGWCVEAQFFASPSYLTKRGVPLSLSDLANHDQANFWNASSVTLEGPDGQESFEPNGRITSNNILILYWSILSGVGIGLLPRFIAEKNVAAGQLVPVLPNYRALDAYVYILRPSMREVPRRVRALSDFLFEYMKSNPLVARIT